MDPVSHLEEQSGQCIWNNNIDTSRHALEATQTTRLGIVVRTNGPRNIFEKDFSGLNVPIGNEESTDL
ncbi:Uncharacterized protein FKW44_018742 [Caligus rogercresseyi]|uniref:Uncharacterized protein n=1 Tax=Caligus rogercresseyi TaxID=217165 RepID=A0A7T8GUZ3_CALRO|nr:Uncharacterized protein FKW44_018742 [Caligus rogercresseyi]